MLCIQIAYHIIFLFYFWLFFILVLQLYQSYLHDFSWRCIKCKERFYIISFINRPIFSYISVIRAPFRVCWDSLLVRVLSSEVEAAHDAMSSRCSLQVGMQRCAIFMCILFYLVLCAGAARALLARPRHSGCGLVRQSGGIRFGFSVPYARCNTDELVCLFIYFVYFVSQPAALNGLRCLKDIPRANCVGIGNCAIVSLLWLRILWAYYDEESGYLLLYWMVSTVCFIAGLDYFCSCIFISMFRFHVVQEL